MPDFGYWYAPDGRTSEQQRTFESVEVKPQALEMIFCLAAGHRFDVSTDNLNGEQTDPGPFRAKVHAQAKVYLQQGMGERPTRFAQALLDAYQPGRLLDPGLFSKVAAA